MILRDENMPFVATMTGEVYAQFKGLVEFDELLQEGRIAVWRWRFGFVDGVEHTTAEAARYFAIGGGRANNHYPQKRSVMGSRFVAVDKPNPIDILRKI